KIEALRHVLSAEGLFDPERKTTPPFLPQCVGLVTAKDSDAEKDVLHNAKERWPEVQFHVEHASVQGDRAVPEIIAALDRLDNGQVDVIVIARGGGDFQHLLPFSDERLLRRVAALRIPVISAIGHQADKPLLDDVADVRASTPTDAAKRVVPDVAEERLRINDARSRLRLRLHNLVDGESQRLDMMRQRPVLATPSTVVDRHAEDVLRLVQRGVDVTDTLLTFQRSRLESLEASVRALSPQATLDRGYAIVQAANGALVSSPLSVTPGDALRLRVKDGDIAVEVTNS
ncbi:MAG: exodeoxyribonuclease VII large subunit, partial [Pontimonas sp.]